MQVLRRCSRCSRCSRCRRCRRCRVAGADREVQRWSCGVLEVLRCRGADMEV